jgi:hypothetical protein
MKNKIKVEAAAPANADQLSLNRTERVSIRHNANRELPTQTVLEFLRAQLPQQYELAEVVGKWVWLDVSPARKLALAKMLWASTGISGAVSGGIGQDEAGRLWDVVWMLHFAILRSPNRCDRLPFALYVRNDNTRAKLVKLIATCGPLDSDDPQPAITVMLPDEDKKIARLNLCRFIRFLSGLTPA